MKLKGALMPFSLLSVLQLHQKELLDLSVIHGDGTTTAALKGGSHLG